MNFVRLKNKEKEFVIFLLILSFSLQKEGGSGRALLGNPDLVAIDDHPRFSPVREEPLVILYLGGVPQVGLLSVVFC